ncbi:coproporphyrinogen III oxidase [Spirochaetia bacterium]|nr:coproporphyrinogen III oxidase [Spirochaetia bacterium]
MTEAGVYIHVPFCAGVCDYCDFYSVPVMSADKRLDQFADMVLADLESSLNVHGISRVPTVYIGGGTPSVLGAARLSRLLTGVGDLLPDPQGLREFTLEANPESADEAVLRACRDYGVTRLSLGVQSFHEPSRRAVHRVGETALLPERLKLAAEIFGNALSLDLMTGLPFQTEPILLKDIEKALSYNPGHISLYALTIEENTPLAKVSRILPAPDEADRLWIAARDTLETAGYPQYEVSNFVLPGRQSAHNIRYWRMENWLGLGPGGSGTLIDDETGTGWRRTFIPNLDAWLDRDASRAIYTEEYLDQPALIQESILMGFRCLSGPDCALFEKRFHRPLESLIPQTLRRWKRRGLLQEHTLALTKEALLFLNIFLAEAFEELPHS